MKKIYIPIILFIPIMFSCTTVTIPFMKESYQKTINTNIQKNEAFGKLLKFASTVINPEPTKNVDNTKLISDVTSGIVIFNSWQEIPDIDNQKDSDRIRFTITCECKDNKVRMSFSNVLRSIKSMGNHTGGYTSGVDYMPVADPKKNKLLQEKAEKEADRLNKSIYAAFDQSIDQITKYLNTKDSF